jgi:hypothetical protein
MLLPLALCGCASGFSRHGYTKPDLISAPITGDQPIVIQCNATFDNADVVILGEIRAYDTGISLKCEESYVLGVFCQEGRALGADLVNVTKESYPDLWSTCYRANAQFVRFKDRAKASALVSDAKYNPALIAERSKETFRENAMLFSGDLVFGSQPWCQSATSHSCQHSGGVHH